MTFVEGQHRPKPDLLAWSSAGANRWLSRSAASNFALSFLLRFGFFQMRLGEDFRWQPVLGVGKNQAGFPQPAQQVPVVPGKDFESSALVGRDPRYLQNDCGKAGNFRCLRLRQLFQTSNVSWGNMRLLHKPEDIVPVFYGPPFAFWQTLTAFAHMNFVTLAGKPLVRPHPPADPAIVSHSSYFRFDVRIVNRPPCKKGAGYVVIVSSGRFAQT
jgi:hypothetical protein